MSPQRPHPWKPPARAERSGRVPRQRGDFTPASSKGGCAVIVLAATGLAPVIAAVGAVIA